MQFGKFNSAEELLKSYNELEKSYTQKCQQLAELRKEQAVDLDSILQSEKDPAVVRMRQFVEETSGGTSVVTPPPAQQQSTTVDSADTVPQGNTDVALGGPAAVPTLTAEAVQQFLLDNPSFAEKFVAEKVLQGSGQFAPKVMSGGGNVSVALPSRPKTIKEATLMAKELFK